LVRNGGEGDFGSAQIGIVCAGLVRVPLNVRFNAGAARRHALDLIDDRRAP
jgi:hypothetical protein